MTPPLEIKVSPQALAQIEEAAEWWAQNRLAAPGAIRQDVGEILTILSTRPGVGTPARRGRVKGLRRVTLTRVRYYLYFRVSGSVLEVLAFWHASRGRQPRAFEHNDAEPAIRDGPESHPYGSCRVGMSRPSLTRQTFRNSLIT